MDWTPELLNETIHQLVPFVSRAGVYLQEAGRGYVKMSLPLKGNENHIGSIYAGALFTLSEIPGGVLFLTSFDTKKFIPIIKAMNIQFLSIARTDVHVEVRMSEMEIQRIQKEAVARGKADYILSSQIRNDHGEVVASCEGVYQLRAMGESSGFDIGADSQ